MKGIFLMLVYFLVWLPTWFSIQFSKSDRQESPKQDRSSQVIIDEILQACGPLFFKSNIEELSTDQEECLLEIFLNLRHADNYYLVVDVHRTSSERSEISIGRAKRVRDYLAKQKGINPGRLIVRDFKDSCPYETGDTTFNPRLEFWYWREREKTELIPKRCASGAKPGFRIMD